MAKYIDKDALAAEIERIKKEECPTDSYEGRCKLLWFEQFLSFLNTLKVEEDAVYGTIDYPLIGCDFPNIYPNYKELKEYCNTKGIKDNDKVKLIIIKDM